MNMAVMGGPVGGGAMAGQMNMGSPSNQTIDMSPAAILKKLNTAIYDYLLRNSQYDIAKAFQEKMPIETKPKDEKQANGMDDGMDDTKDPGILKRPEGLPLPNNMHDGPLLQDWWLQFWELWHGQRNRGKNNTMQYLQNQRMGQKGRMNLMGAMDPNMQNLRSGYNMMANNGMPMNPNDLRKSAMQQNNQQRL